MLVLDREATEDGRRGCQSLNMWQNRNLHWVPSFEKVMGQISRTIQNRNIPCTFRPFFTSSTPQGQKLRFNSFFNKGIVTFVVPPQKAINLRNYSGWYHWNAIKMQWEYQSWAAAVVRSTELMHRQIIWDILVVIHDNTKPQNYMMKPNPVSLIHCQLGLRQCQDIEKNALSFATLHVFPQELVSSSSFYFLYTEQAHCH